MTTQQDDKLNVCFCFTDGSGSYYKHPLVALTSVFENTKHTVRAHLLCDETVTTEAREAFLALAARYGQEVKIYATPPIAKAVSDNVRACFGIGTLFRLFLPEMLQERLVLYLDCDIVSTMDIAELFTTPMDNLPAAGVLDIGLHDDDDSINRIKNLGLDPDKYINAGVMLYNLEYIRQNYPNFTTELLDSIARTKYPFVDQDALNIYFQNRGLNICVLPAHCNYFLGIEDRAFYTLPEYSGKILHYTRGKPWKIFYPAALLYWEYYAKAFSCAEAFQAMHQLGTHEYAHLFSFILRNTPMRRMVNRAWQVSEEGLWETMLDRLLPGRKKKKRLLKQSKNDLSATTGGK